MGCKESKHNPLRIPEFFFKSCNMNIDRNVVFFSVFYYPETHMFRGFLNIIMLDKESEACAGANYGIKPVPGFEEGYYFYVKNQGYIKVVDDKHLEDLFQAYNIEIPKTIYVHEIKEVHIPDRKPKLPAKVYDEK